MHSQLRIVDFVRAERPSVVAIELHRPQERRHPHLHVARTAPVFVLAVALEGRVGVAQDGNRHV